jgi:hypothetical protein
MDQPTPTNDPSPPAPDAAVPANAAPERADVPPLPRGIGLFVAVLAVLVLLSALVGIGAAGLQTPRVWFVIGFEVAILVASAFGVLIGLGRFADGPALGLACVAGVIAAGSLLGYLAGQGNLGVDLKPFLLARGMAAAGIAFGAGAAVLLRNPKLSLPRLGIGIACAVAFVVACGLAWRFSASLANLGTVTGALFGLIAAATMLGLLAAAVHLLIGAFEAGSVEEPAASK